jgi:site-specific DNA-methyltransferase (adenine-specific)
MQNEHGNSRVFLQDCMELMKQYPDGYFDLAVTDPPYGININMNQGRRSRDIKKHKNKKWDSSAPSADYWNELRRVSRNQIVWGANNFEWIPAHNGYIVWDKDISGDVQFSKCELAYCSILKTIQKVKIRAQTGPETYSSKIHPTQKPVALYDWIFQNYAKHGDKIIDTHLGSGSSRIAAWKHGLDFTGCELDAEYYEASIKRFEDHIKQLTLF